MRISFDLDGTLICYGNQTPLEPRLASWLRMLFSDEPLRAGTVAMLKTLRRQGHEIWIYTSSHRRPRAVRWSFAARGVRITRVINGAEHARCFPDLTVTKRPDAFGIDLHVDDSEGVAIEGQRLGFRVLRIKIDDPDWTRNVLAAVEKTEFSTT